MELVHDAKPYLRHVAWYMFNILKLLSSGLPRRCVQARGERRLSNLPSNCRASRPIVLLGRRNADVAVYQ